jgi:hypothetical protein
MWFHDENDVRLGMGRPLWLTNYLFESPMTPRRNPYRDRSAEPGLSRVSFRQSNGCSAREGRLRRRVPAEPLGRTVRVGIGAPVA